MRRRWIGLGLWAGGGLLVAAPLGDWAVSIAAAQTAPPGSDRPKAVVIDPRDDRVQRRAIRGGPLDLSRESPELRELRSFEEESFPTGSSRRSIGNLPSSSLPSSSLMDPKSPLPSGGGPDVLPEGMHSALRPPPSGEPPATSERPTIPWLAALKLLDNLGLSPTFVRFEGHVIRYLEFFKEERRGRSIMASWLRKQGRYKALIEQTLDRHALPRFLLYVAMIESGYDPHDRSNKGAVGLWQFMPEGARIYGLRVDYWIDERKDPVRSTDAAARYLGDLKARFGSWHLALAAFNAGYGAVLRSMQKYNTNDYWELCRHEDGLPWETLNYVPKAIASAVVGENRSFFGYEELTPDPALQFDTVHVTSSLGFDKIAKAIGCTTDELARLNPELRRGRTPPLLAGESWALRLPLGSGGLLTAQLESLRKAEPLMPYVVRFGERIDDLARERGVSASSLRRINGIEDRDSAEVRAGLTLLLPPLSSGRPSAATLAPGEEISIVAVPDKNLIVPGKQRLFYRVIPGDTIWAIARFFKVKESDLLRWNNLDPEATLATRLVLDVWVDPDFDSSQVVLVDPHRVRVVTTGSDEFFEIVETLRGRKRVAYSAKAGDTLERIAKKYGQPIADIERINRLGRQTDLTPGQKIIVYLPLTSSERSAAIARLRGETPATDSEAASSSPLSSADSSDSNKALRPAALPDPPPADSDRLPTPPDEPAKAEPPASDAGVERPATSEGPPAPPPTPDS